MYTLASASIKPKLTASTLTSQVESYIIDLIRDQGLKPGDEIPSEMQIVKDLNISRGVVREAYRALGTLGIVEIRSGKRPKVKVFDSEVLEMVLSFASSTAQVNLEQIIELREGLELSCVAHAANRISDDEISILKAEMKGLEKHVGNSAMFIEHDLHFHKILAVASHNPLYSLMLQALHQQIYLSIKGGFELQGSKKQRNNIVALHQNICDAVCSHDPKAAAAALHEHFKTVSYAFLAAEESGHQESKAASDLVF